MKLDIFLQKQSNIVAENRLLRLIIFVIGIVVLINTFMLYKSLNSHRTILLPPVVNSKIEISGNKASDEYIKEFARYISSLAFSYTPMTARTQFAELLVLFSSSAFPEAKNLFYSLADTIELTKIVNTFFIQKIAVDSVKNQIEVRGQRMKFAEDGKRIEDSVVTYLIDYVINNGRFEILKISEKETT